MTRSSSTRRAAERYNTSIDGGAWAKVVGHVEAEAHDGGVVMRGGERHLGAAEEEGAVAVEGPRCARASAIDARTGR